MQVLTKIKNPTITRKVESWIIQISMHYGASEHHDEVEQFHKDITTAMEEPQIYAEDPDLVYQPV